MCYKYNVIRFVKYEMKIPFILVTLFYFGDCVVYPSVPTHLLECYRGGGPPLGAPRGLDVLLSLLKKLENSSQLDLRLFSAALLRSVRLDGIEEAPNAVETMYVTPYRASAFQFHKYKLLMDLFLSSQSLLDVDESLTATEKCLLHEMLSSSVRQWERGDEDTVCPITMEQRQTMATIGLNETRLISRCPIETGVVQTEWGTISPGVVIAAMATALEPQRVSVADILNTDVFKADVAEPLMVSAKEEWYTDIETLNTADNQTSTSADISNVWVATLAGDLAEVIVIQGPRVGSASHRMVVGSNNRWNDTLLPRSYYLLAQNITFPDWHLTDAEMLAGIDGLILANYISDWIEQRRTVRLSQIIDMYYSSAGVSFDSSVKACNRPSLFSKIFNSSQLLTESSRFAHVLSLRYGFVYMPVEEIERISASAVAAFENYMQTLLRNNEKECGASSTVPSMNLIVATDASWKGYDVQKFVSWVGKSIELDLQRSTLALLHGNTGGWIAPPSNNMTALFSHISNFTGEWPNRLNLPVMVSTIIQHSQNMSLAEMSGGASVALSTVVLLVSPADRPSATELQRASELMRTLRTTYFDVYFVYVSQDVTDFQNLNSDNLDYSELFLTTASPSVSDVINAINAELIKGNNIPIRIIGVHCPFNGTEYAQGQYEDFVLPNDAKLYRINPYYLKQQAFINVQFRNDGQGQLLACAWRGADSSRDCRNINEREISTFNLTTPCPSIDFCLPAYFSVTGTSTLNLCANNDCRVPNQIGYYIEHEGLRCLSLRSSSSTMLISKKMFFTFFFIISLLNYN